MTGGRGRRYLARYGAPAAFLAAATAAVVLVRAGLGDNGAARRPAMGEPRIAVSSPPAGPVRKRFYVIRAGDTLGGVAERFQTTVVRLLELNPGVEPTSLRIGQRIRTS